MGRTADGRLIADIGFDQPAQMPRSVFPGFPGYVTTLVGFANAPFDDADAGVYSLASGSDISARLTAVDPGLRLYNGLPVLQVGESMFFGSPEFDYHPIYSIPNPGAAHGVTYTLRLVLHDASGLYADSDEFSLGFTPACPADHNLSGMVGVQDIFDFLADYFHGFGEADFNRSGAVTVQDLFDFLGEYFVACG